MIAHQRNLYRISPISSRAEPFLVSSLPTFLYDSPPEKPLQNQSHLFQSGALPSFFTAYSPPEKPLQNESHLFQSAALPSFFTAYSHQRNLYRISPISSRAEPSLVSSLHIAHQRNLYRIGPISSKAQPFLFVTAHQRNLYRIGPISSRVEPFLVFLFTAYLPL